MFKKHWIWSDKNIYNVVSVFEENLKIFKMTKAVVNPFTRALQVRVSFSFRVLLILQYVTVE
jgi:hypothetical protein